MSKEERPLIAGTTNDPQTESSIIGKDQTQMSNTTTSSNNQQAKNDNRTNNYNPIRITLKPLDAIFKDTALLKKLNKFPLTDVGNAECFALLFHQSLRYCKSIKKWMKWDGVKWNVDSDGEANRAAIFTARARKAAAVYINNADLKTNTEKWSKESESVSRRNAMLNTAIHLDNIETTIERFDSNQFLAGVKNGTLDLSNGTFKESNKEDYISKQFNVEYDPNAKAPRWERFLEEVFNGDKELIAFIQKAVGYSLTGDTSEQVIFLCYGNGANGKSVFLDILSYLMVDYAANCSFSTFEANRRNEATNDLAALKGKRLVTAIETNEDKRMDEARVKSVTGQDKITARFLYGEFFSYKPQFKIWMAVNHKPLIKGTDRGIWRRIKLIPFTQNFENKQDPYLTAKLKEELSGILNWALDGLKLWRENRLGTAKAIQESTNEYKKESDLIQQWFDDCIEIISDFNTPCSDVYNSFVEWCRFRGYPFWSMNSFSRAMTEKGFKSRNKGRYREYVGLALTGDSH